MVAEVPTFTVGILACGTRRAEDGIRIGPAMDKTWGGYGCL